MRMKKPKAIDFEESSCNIFADLGLEESDELNARAQIGVHVFKILEARKLKREIAAVLGIAARCVAPDERAFQPLHHGQAARFSEAPGPESEDRGQSSSQGGALPAGHLRSVGAGHPSVSVNRKNAKGWARRRYGIFLDW